MGARNIWILAAYISFVLIDVSNGVDEACYPPLPCLPLGAPWTTFFRPLPAPLPPLDIETRLYLYSRGRPARYHGTTRPEPALGQDAGFEAGRRTFFITHGFSHDGNKTWLRDMKDALLEKFDANVILVDWGRGAGSGNYFLVAANIRVVAAEVIRFAHYLIDTHGCDVANWHLIGHSLGAHVFSYVAKAIPGIAELTALDPAQPAFEGYSKAVRLDASDARFVAVIHTNARPFIPLAGLGMMGPVGHVDYYMNGGLDQPGCLTPPARLFSLTNLAAAQLKELLDYVGCPHQRSYVYFTSSVRHDNCTFWGRRLQDILIGRECGADNCSPLGLDAINYPARGSFHVLTTSLDPFCFSDAEVDANMSRYRGSPKDERKTTEDGH